MASGDKWSPELINVRSKETGHCVVRHKCLYQWMWSCKHGNKRDYRGIISGRVSIENTDFNRPVGKFKNKTPIHALQEIIALIT
jgi:IS30 family transposase